MGSGQRNAKGRYFRPGREKLNGGLFRLLTVNAVVGKTPMSIIAVIKRLNALFKIVVFM